MRPITIDCPEALHKQLQELVRAGWEESEQSALIEALRRYLNARTSDTLERQFHRDVEWGLHGKG